MSFEDHLCKGLSFFKVYQNMTHNGIISLRIVIKVNNGITHFTPQHIQFDNIKITDLRKSLPNVMNKGDSSYKIVRINMFEYDFHMLK